MHVHPVKVGVVVILGVLGASEAAHVLSWQSEVRWDCCGGDLVSEWALPVSVTSTITEVDLILYLCELVLKDTKGFRVGQVGEFAAGHTTVEVLPGSRGYETPEDNTMGIRGIQAGTLTGILANTLVGGTLGVDKGDDAIRAAVLAEPRLVLDLLGVEVLSRGWGPEPPGSDSFMIYAAKTTSWLPAIGWMVTGVSGVSHVCHNQDNFRCLRRMVRKYLHLRCCAHIVNLIVNDGLKKMHDSVVVIRNAVKFVKSSPSRFDKFKKCVEHEKIQNKGLVVLDVPTRWNSTYLMLASSLKFVKAFDRLDDEDGHY
ncbi:hypothetical protein Dsin_022211 [Dipteronia sinensis]|uniref:Transposase n=1 Tax=Dipteronia sinensis TaxID=43782 RepID=A0AAE0A2E8_9ROSI|nr:hypothetical protein Dsin_022211 [Dipteronia sinensis]